MKLKRLFLSLAPEDKDRVCAAIIEAGLGKEFGTLEFRAFLKTQMLNMHGAAREYLKLFRRLDAEEQERFYKAMTTYEDVNEFTH